MNSKSKLFFKVITNSLFMLLLIQPMFSETFRVHKTTEINIQSSLEPITVTAGINDALAISLPENSYFIQGIEVYVKIPKPVSDWFDCVAWSLYNEISPEPTEKRIDYTGERITVGTFGANYSKIITIPLTKDNTIKKDPYAINVEQIPDLKNGKVFFRLQLAMKGTSEDVFDSQFEITVKPILTNKGKITINLIPPSGNDKIDDCTVYIDGTQIDNSSKSILLDAGEHHLNVQSAKYRNEVRNITVKKADETSITISLKDIAPLVRISAPERTQVFLDGEQIKVNSNYFTIEEGRHSFKFIVDDYEITKTLNAINGRNYTVSVTLDAVISDDE